jgi:hypothetical protein
MQHSVSRRRASDHVHEQLLNLARLLDAATDLPGSGRMACRYRRTQGVDVAGDTVGHIRHPSSDQCPIVIGVGGHQVEYVAHRLQRRGDHIEVADIQSGVVQFDLQTEPLAHSRNRDVVDFVGRGGVVQLVQRRPCGFDTGAHTVGGVVGDVVIVAEDAHFRCRAWVKRRERVEIAFGDGVYRRLPASRRRIARRLGPNQGWRSRRCRTCSGRRSDNQP